MIKIYTYKPILPWTTYDNMFIQTFKKDQSEYVTYMYNSEAILHEYYYQPVFLEGIFNYL